MATDATTPTDVTEGFGQVSRSVGRLFRYLLLAATLFGIVFVTILLVYVANDAIPPRPRTSTGATRTRSTRARSPSAWSSSRSCSAGAPR